MFDQNVQVRDTRNCCLCLTYRVSNKGPIAGLFTFWFSLCVYLCGENILLPCRQCKLHRPIDVSLPRTACEIGQDQVVSSANTSCGAKETSEKSIWHPGVWEGSHSLPAFRQSGVRLRCQVPFRSAELCVKISFIYRSFARALTQEMYRFKKKNPVQKNACVLRELLSLCKFYKYKDSLMYMSYGVYWHELQYIYLFFFIYGQLTGFNCARTPILIFFS